MANARNTRLRFLEESLKSLLQEGSKYSHILEKLYHRNRSAYSDFQKVLCIMDNYSRHKTALKEDASVLNEVTDDSPVEFSEYVYYEETETEDEETMSPDEVYNSYDKWVNLLILVIRDRKNVLTKLERTFLEIIEPYRNLITLQSHLNDHLENYCGRVVTVLKQITDMENRLGNQFKEKQKKLVEILDYISEMRKFFWGDNTSAMETV